MNEKKNRRNHLPVRLNILFFLVFLLFSALILRLGIIQIVQGEEFQEQLERTVNISAPIEAPRGLIYDRYGNVLVDNELLFTVTFTNRHTPQQEMLETAEKLNKYISLTLPRINDRELREYWGLLYPEEFEEKLTVEEASELELSNSDAHTERINAITQEELDSLTEHEMEIFPFWREFNVGYNNLPHKIKRGITYEEAALIMENLEELPGIDIIRDSDRVYIYEDSLRSIFGRVGSIPRDEIDFYLANGYERNEQVGTSYLEYQYESVLRGRKGRLNNFMDGSGNFLRNPQEQLGSRGNDLVLTFDMELQQRVQEIIRNEVEEVESKFVGDPDAYVVVMEPHTGDILAMVGYNNDQGTFTHAYEPGSAIKGVTVLAGLDTGVVSTNTRILDRTINLPQSPPISSHRPLGYVDVYSALEQSSNIYMVEIAMRLVGYIPGVSGTNWGNFYRGYDILRSYYNQFGLGINTGIDLPNEFRGIGTDSSYPGSLLFLSFGQFDTYTPLQLAQYVSTLSNGGYRIAPRVVKEIREPGSSRDELGPLSQQLEPKVLNKVDIDESYMDSVRRGFYQVVYGNRGTGQLLQAPYEPAGKTGTAQVTINRDGNLLEANNQTFVGYAPYDNPEVAISVVVPGMHVDEGGVANRISKEVFDAYFELKENRRGPLLPGETYEEFDDDEDDEDEEIEEEIN
ncbi:penicillin-binding protein 2 [Evansella sp. AB-P1]|uniref:peptidoglycan D,D-transpeptidase FtsI family protein n=1 Tax=Evansella sp. AB-P1 TaxID=3037653 RepID=UPI00241DC9CC|nr:penicillin-binding protein 2 [Evansella sp. AB-P1]MDG5788754.1 penicillin-binding protein 2 [Evansella sp. AB-P1]